MTEIFRAGIQAVPGGQREAAEALGMPERLVMRRIVLPQAIRIVIPAIGNEFVAMIKDSSLVSILAVEELLFRARLVGQQNFRSLEALIIAAAIYWILTIALQPLPAAPRAADGARRPMTATAPSARSSLRQVDGHREVLRRPPRPARHRPRRAAARGRDDRRPIREREDDPPALHQLPRGANGRLRWRSTGFDSRPIRCRRAAGDTRSRSVRCASAPACSSRSSTSSRT